MPCLIHLRPRVTHEFWSIWVADEVFVDILDWGGRLGSCQWILRWFRGGAREIVQYGISTLPWFVGSIGHENPVEAWSLYAVAPTRDSTVAMEEAKRM